METREAKFRVWDGKKFYNPIICRWKIYRTNQDYEYWISSDNDKLLQFTGLKDMHGKEIYEGDIVDIWENGLRYDLPSKVIYSQYGWFQFYDVPFQDVFRNNSYKVEVVGNIYENPELLGIKK